MLYATEVIAAAIEEWILDSKKIAKLSIAALIC